MTSPSRVGSGGSTGRVGISIEVRRLAERNQLSNGSWRSGRRRTPALVRNALTDPFLLGISSGASVGPTAVLLFGAFASIGVWAISFGSVVGALVAMATVFVVANKGRQLDPTQLILCGVVVSALLESVTSFLIFRGNPQATQSVLLWLLGSFGLASWTQLPIPTIPLVVAMAFLLAQARSLNALAMGTESAASLGVDVQRLRRNLFVVTSLMAGVCVAVSGIIGFVGLVVATSRTIRSLEHAAIGIRTWTFKASAVGALMPSGTASVLPTRQLRIRKLALTVGTSVQSVPCRLQNRLRLACRIMDQFRASALTHLLVVSDARASRDWYTRVFDASIYGEYGGTSVVLELFGNWVLLVTGGRSHGRQTDRVVRAAGRSGPRQCGDHLPGRRLPGNLRAASVAGCRLRR